MKINPLIQELIAEKVIAEKEDRTMSGRLSASKLGWPLQWQMLNYCKVPQAEPDEYTLRKFQRGKDVEERIMRWLAPQESQMQVPVTYRGVRGVADVILNHPIEIKSVTNRAFKHIQKEGSKRGHRLQGELYAKAMKSESFEVAYVASDDYRVLSFEHDTTDVVDKIIDRYEEQVSLGVVPVFMAEEKWHGNEKYNPYPEWMELSELEIATKLDAMGVVVPGGGKEATKKMGI